MKNTITLLDDKTAYLNIPYDNDVFHTLIDRDMIESVAKIPGRWKLSLNNSTLKRRFHEDHDRNAYYTMYQHKTYESGHLECYTILLHRLIMIAAGHDIEGKIVDHRNGITNDCRLENLQVTTQGVNVRKQILDSRPHKNNTSGHRCVTLEPSGRWAVCVAHVWYGAYDTIEQAANVADQVRKAINIRNVGRA